MGLLAVQCSAEVGGCAVLCSAEVGGCAVLCSAEVGGCAVLCFPVVVEQAKVLLPAASGQQRLSVCSAMLLLGMLQTCWQRLPVHGPCTANMCRLLLAERDAVPPSA